MANAAEDFPPAFAGADRPPSPAPARGGSSTSSAAPTTRSPSRGGPRRRLAGRLLDGLDRFGGLAVTRDGRAWSGRTGELRRVAPGGGERVLAERNRRERLVADSERAVQAEHAARAAVEAANAAVAEADAARDEADRARRDADRARGRRRRKARAAPAG